MKLNYFVTFLLLAFLLSCSDSGEDQINIEEVIIGTWSLDLVRVEGSGCESLYPGVPTEYAADDIGCVVRSEMTGSTKNCVNFEFRAGGEGTFLWSEINRNGENAEITYEINDDNEVRYCFSGSSFNCSGYFKLVANQLESSLDSSFDPDLPCEAIFVLTRG